MNIQTKQLQSQFLNKAITYHVIPPASGAESVHILYVQDGNDYLELGNFAEAFANAGLKDWMVVLVHPGTSEERWQSYHHKGKHFPAFQDFMYEEIMPLVEKDYIVEGRALLGDSLAANISLHLAARKPSMWSHLLLQSAAISQNDIAVVEQLEEPIPWRVHQTVGTKEDEFISSMTNERLFIYTRNKQLAEVFRNKGVDLQFVEEDESHLWVYWERILPDALSFL